MRRAHSSTFAPKVSDVGHTFTVRVTATKAGYTSTTLESAPTLAVASA